MTGLHPVCQRFDSVIEHYRDLVQLVELQSPKLSVGRSNRSVPANKVLFYGTLMVSGLTVNQVYG